jgi:hypothetical protein
MRYAASIALSTLALALAATGCGGGGDTSSTAATSTSAEGAPPTELVGTYSMALKPGDLPPNPPTELTDRAEKWTLEIADGGAPGGGPAFTIINDQLGTLESSQLEVAGDRIFLHNEECAGSPGPVESEYRWRLTGQTLELTSVTTGCDDDVVLTLLTSEPWLKR